MSSWCSSAYVYGRGGQRVPVYVCVGRGRDFGDPACQSIVGTSIDAAVGQLLVEAVTPMALELTLAVQQELDDRLDEADRWRHRQVERAPYEADQARQRVLTLPRPLTAPQQRVTHEDVRQQIHALLGEYTDAQVAHQLNQRGLHTGAGEAFDTHSVKWVRHAHKLNSLKQRLLDEGWLTGRQTQARLGVKRTTLSRWRTTGQIKARICTDLGEWLYSLPAEADDGVIHPTTSPKDSSTARGAV